MGTALAIVVFVIVMLVLASLWSALAEGGGPVTITFRVLAALAGAVLGFIDTGFYGAVAGALIAFLASTLVAFALLALGVVLDGDVGEGIARILGVLVFCVVAREAYWLVNSLCMQETRNVAIVVVNATRDHERAEGLEEELGDHEGLPRALGARPARWLLKGRVAEINEGTLELTKGKGVVSDSVVFRNVILNSIADRIADEAERLRNRYYGKTWITRHVVKLVRQGQEFLEDRF